MFQTLRRRFIATTMVLISIVMILSFGAIYFATVANLERELGQRTMRIDLPSGFANPQAVNDFLDERHQDYIDRTLRGLVVTLLLTGTITLVAAYFVSRYVADKAISPVREAYDKQKRFIADASHELKTPLAVIDSNIEAELVGRKRPSKWLENIRGETERMNRLVSNLLALAKLDSADLKAQTADFDLSEITEKAVTSVEALAHKKSLSLSLRTEKPLSATSDTEKIRQIITILLDNAIKYTDKGGKIEVTTRSTDKTTELIVSNTHPKISRQKFDKLFDRFYQADTSHHENGHGLGLAIAKTAAESVGATLEASQTNGVINFTLTIRK